MDPLDYLSGRSLQQYERAYAQLMSFTCKYGYLTACKIWKKQYEQVSLKRKQYKTLDKRLTRCQQVVSVLGILYGDKIFQPEHQNPKYATALLHLRQLMKTKAKVLHTQLDWR